MNFAFEHRKLKDGDFPENTKRAPDNAVCPKECLSQLDIQKFEIQGLIIFVISSQRFPNLTNPIEVISIFSTAKKFVELGNSQ